jgi:hypothetical protein
MANTQWVNRSQPQTLFIATIVMYINAVFGIIFGRLFTYSGSPLFFVLELLLVLGPVAAGLGIANEKKWGYWLGVVLTALEVLFLVAFFSAGEIINLLFYVALLALLLHPMSRNYYRTWFR